MTSHLVYFIVLIFFRSMDFGVTTPAPPSDSEAQNVISNEEQPTSSTEELPDQRFVQKYVTPAPGSDQFAGYSCALDEDCEHDGRCLSTEFGGSLCNCSGPWLGPQCSYSSILMTYKLINYPMVRYMFLTCLNQTGRNAGVHALTVYLHCAPGDSACWIRLGGANAIKVLFWCLNTGYRMLISEGKAKVEVRWNNEVLKELIQKFIRRGTGDANRSSDELLDEEQILENTSSFSFASKTNQTQNDPSREIPPELGRIIGARKASNSNNQFSYSKKSTEDDEDYLGAFDADQSFVENIP